MRACVRAHVCICACVRVCPRVLGEREAETLTSSFTDGLILIIIQQWIGSPRRQFKDRSHATEQQDKDICLSNGRQQSTIYSGWQPQLLQLLDLPLSLPLTGLICLAWSVWTRLNLGPIPLISALLPLESRHC